MERPSKGENLQLKKGRLGEKAPMVCENEKGKRKLGSRERREATEDEKEEKTGNWIYY